MKVKSFEVLVVVFSFTGVEELTNSIVADISSGNAFVFAPLLATNYALDVRAEIYERFYLEWGPVGRVTATPPHPVIQFASARALTGNRVEMEITVTNHRPGMTFQLYKATNPAGTWSRDASAGLQTVIPNSRFRFTTTVSATRACYRVTSSY